MSYQGTEQVGAGAGPGASVLLVGPLLCDGFPVAPTVWGGGGIDSLGGGGNRPSEMRPSASVQVMDPALDVGQQ